MNKRNYFQILNLLLIYIIFINIHLSSCIKRAHKHPGSTNSDNSNVEIVPLSEDDNSNLQDNIRQEINTNTNNGKNSSPPPIYNEDDEFVYSKKDEVLNLDQELERRDPNGQNMNHKKMNIQNTQDSRYIPNSQDKMNFDNQKRFKDQQNMYNNIHYQQNGPERPVGPHMQGHPGGPHMQGYPGGPHMQGYPGGPHMQGHPGQPRPDVYRTGVDEHGQPYTYTAGEGPHSKYQNQETENGQPKTNVSKARKALGLFYQLIMVFFLVSFIYNYFLGKNQNDKHALVWYNANKDYFEERYEYFGLEEDDKLSKKIPKNNFIKNCKMSKENPYYYKLSCANYRYIHYLTVVLEFKKRYDVTSILSSIFISPRDRIVFQVSFKPNDDLGWIFCVCKKKKAKSLKKSYEDLNYFCEIYEPSSFNNYMALISESLEVFMELFNNKSLFKYYKDIEDYLDAIYYSDMLNMEVEGTNIFFSFGIDLTKPKQEKILLEITHFVNLFVDTLAQLKYNKAFKEKTKKSRVMYERTKMDPSKKREIEEKEQKDFIDKWNIIRKMRTKKGAERRKLERELKNYQ